jgi:hypothetical protein
MTGTDDADHLEEMRVRGEGVRSDSVTYLYKIFHFQDSVVLNKLIISVRDVILYVGFFAL